MELGFSRDCGNHFKMVGLGLRNMANEKYVSASSFAKAFWGDNLDDHINFFFVKYEKAE